MRPSTLLLTTLALAWCGLAYGQDAAARLNELKENRDRWKSSGISNYEITLEDQACYCLFGPYYGPIKLFVQDGKIKKAIYLGEIRDGYKPGDRIRIETHLKRTIEQLFGELETALSRASNEITLQIQYDPVHGFPSLIEVNNSALGDHGESRIVVSDFSAGK